MSETNDITESLAMTSDPYSQFNDKQILDMVSQLRDYQKDEYNKMEKEIQKFLLVIQRRKPKLCPACFKTQGETSFAKNRLRKDGMQVYCRNCMKEKQFRAKNRVIPTPVEN